MSADNATFKVELTISVRFVQEGDWVRAYSKHGSVVGRSREDCIRMIGAIARGEA